MPIRPGLCALGVPSRFYGGEREAAAVVAEHLVGSGLWDCRIGIADGIFAAEQAARHATAQDCSIVPVGGSAAFLAELSVGVLEDLDLVSLLRRLGIRSRSATSRPCRLAMCSPASGRRVPGSTGWPAAWIHGWPQPAGRHWILINMLHFSPALETVEPIVFSCRLDRGGAHRPARPARLGLHRSPDRGRRRSWLAGIEGLGPLRDGSLPPSSARSSALLAAAGRPVARAGRGRPADPRDRRVAGRSRRGVVGQRSGRANRARCRPAAGHARSRAGAVTGTPRRSWTAAAAGPYPLGGAWRTAPFRRAAVARQHPAASSGLGSSPSPALPRSFLPTASRYGSPSAGR